MKKLAVTRSRALAVALGLSVVLGACSLFGPRGAPEKPVVTFKDGRIAVVPEPLIFKVGGGPVEIVWRIDGKLQFADKDGITIDGELAVRDGPIVNPRQDEIVNCRASEDRQQFTCTNKRSRKGIFKYTVRLVQDGRPLPAHDPGIMNIE